MVTGRSVSRSIIDWVVVSRRRRLQDRQRLQTSTLATHPNDHPDVSTPQSVGWRRGYNTTSTDGESLDSRVTSNNLGLYYNPKQTASFFSLRWNVGTNPDLASASFGQDSRLPDRRVPRKFPQSQHRPSLITPPRFKVPARSDPVKRWNFRKAVWKRFCLLIGECDERLPLPDTPNIGKAYQDICNFLQVCGDDQMWNQTHCYDTSVLDCCCYIRIHLQFFKIRWNKTYFLCNVFIYRIQKQEYMLVKTLIEQGIPNVQDCLPHGCGTEVWIWCRMWCAVCTMAYSHKSETHRPICLMLATNRTTPVLRRLSWTEAFVGISQPWGCRLNTGMKNSWQQFHKGAKRFSGVETFRRF